MSISRDLLVFWQAGSVPRPETVHCYAAPPMRSVRFRTLTDASGWRAMGAERA